MTDFSSIADLATKIKDDLVAQTDKKSIALLYAFNATGKTRLSVEFDNLNDNDDGQIKALSYNAFLEDLFVWDNNEYVLKFDPNHWAIKLIISEGLDNKIVDNYKLITNSKVEPRFAFPGGEVTFYIARGDDSGASNIKISKSEESLLVWSIFYSLLEVAIEELSLKEEERSTDIFNHLEYIVIDDPVSSIDDERIISLAVKLYEVVKSCKNNEINFLITTHHALFFNVLFNSFRNLARKTGRNGGVLSQALGKITNAVNLKGGKYYYFYILSTNNNVLVLENQNDDSPFAYHILVKNKLKEAIENDGLEKYHFNLFRTLLEKTSNFLGYAQWSDCLLGEETKEEVKRLVNLYSHSKLSELESGSLSNADKELFTEAFNAFVEDFKYQ